MENEFIRQFLEPQTPKNKWDYINPLCKLIICASISIATFAVGSWQLGALVLIVSLGIAIYTKKTKAFLAMVLLVFLSAGIMGAAVRISTHLSDGGPIAFTLFGVAVPVSALMNYLDYVLMMEGFVCILVVFFITTEIRDLCYCLERIGMSPKVTFLVLVAFSMISAIQEKLNTVRESQSARGIEMEGNFWVKVKTIIPILFPVIISSITSVEERTLAMNARAFGASRHNSHLRNLRKVNGVDISLVVVCLIISVALIAFKALGFSCILF